jgi:hypothetical protein
MARLIAMLPVSVTDDLLFVAGHGRKQVDVTVRHIIGIEGNTGQAAFQRGVERVDSNEWRGQQDAVLHDSHVTILVEHKGGRPSGDQAMRVEVQRAIG